MTDRTYWEENLDKLFNKIQKTDGEILMNIISIVVFNRFQYNIGKLYRSIGDMNKFIELINVFSNQSIRFPDMNEFKDALMLAIIFYYKNVKNMSWDEIAKQFPYEKDIPIRFGKRVACVDRTIQNQLIELLNENKDNELTIFD